MLIEFSPQFIYKESKEIENVLQAIGQACVSLKQETVQDISNTIVKYITKKIFREFIKI